MALDHNGAFVRNNPVAGATGDYERYPYHYVPDVPPPYTLKALCGRTITPDKYVKAAGLPQGRVCTRCVQRMGGVR